ncbi:MAG: hypothetical protein U5L04_02450 [Trueperaceae bacterium]|nr:hypothetical protein [Trueperaceae bacterium]
MTDYGDRYYTPPAVTRAMIQRVPITLGSQVLEPCAGDGWIARVLEEYGSTVTTADVNPRADVDYPGVDFMGKRAQELFEGEGYRCIITNPPWSAAALFVRRALELAPTVIMLLRLTFEEPCSDRDRKESYREDLVQDIAGKLTLPRVSFVLGGSGTDSASPAWFMWKRGHWGGYNGGVVTKSDLRELEHPEDFDGVDLETLTGRQAAAAAGQCGLFADEGGY